MFCSVMTTAQLDSTLFSSIVDLPFNNAIYGQLAVPDTSVQNMFIIDQLGYIRRQLCNVVLYDVLATPNTQGQFDISPLKLEIFDLQGNAIEPKNIFRN